ncbi:MULTISPECIES: prepilin-type N-terminal cleavage/methylation domain-containing protein [Sulfurimonas]|uniref:prepilin-type N-terminal cleavage/methylation domain-containing protein n=1 Tax=Sulfurimonas TaxID=202746 RepID=UPI0012647CA7|nr:prepilin-type N-terminal cleavage/methylation domain-containing protein [Sulfurimonas indica]
MKRGAFSLIELMIVIVIIGVVYTLVVTNIHQAPQQQKAQLSLKNLKEYLLAFSHDNKPVRLLCKDSCQKCTLYSEKEKLQEDINFLQDAPQCYRYDFFLGPLSVEDNNCFDFSVDSDGVSTQIFVAYKGKVYDYTPYFSETKVYDSLSEAVDAKEQLIRAVQ